MDGNAETVVIVAEQLVQFPKQVELHRKRLVFDIPQLLLTFVLLLNHDFPFRNCRLSADRPAAHYLISTSGAPPRKQASCDEGGSAVTTEWVGIE